MELGYKDIQRLADILKPKDDSDSDDDDDLPQNAFAKLGPGHIGPKKKDDSGGDGAASVEEKVVNEDAIWDDKEVPDIAIGDDSSDPRERPEYDIKYRQSVTPEDIYLQMGGKTPTTACCEDMVVTIKLPEETRSDVNLAVTRERLDIRSPRYRLSLALPHPVDPDSSRAEWRGDCSNLVVTLRMQREFDFVNF